MEVDDVPVGHGAHSVSRPGVSENVPIAQGMQKEILLLPPSTVLYVPAVQFSHKVAPSVGEILPAGHAVHGVARPWSGPNVPIGQGVQVPETTTPTPPEVPAL